MFCYGCSLDGLDLIRCFIMDVQATVLLYLKKTKASDLGIRGRILISDIESWQVNLNKENKNKLQYTLYKC